jgi:hypothetical protein
MQSCKLMTGKHLIEMKDAPSPSLRVRTSRSKTGKVLARCSCRLEKKLQSLTHLIGSTPGSTFSFTFNLNLTNNSPLREILNGSSLSPP